MISNISAEDLFTFQEKAKMLEIKIKQTDANNQIREIAEEAARSYFILSTYLMLKEQADRPQLVELIKKFSKIESEAVMRFYKYNPNERTVSIL